MICHPLLPEVRHVKHLRPFAQLKATIAEQSGIAIPFCVRFPQMPERLVQDGVGSTPSPSVGEIIEAPRLSVSNPRAKSLLAGPMPQIRGSRMIPELTLRYDHDLHPVSAQCSSCGRQMPLPPPDLRDAADIVQWFSVHFIEHRKQEHPAPPYGSSGHSEDIQ